MQKKLISHCRQCPSEDNRSNSATRGLPTTSIGWEAMKNKLQESLKDWQNGMDISSDKSKVLVNSIKPKPSTNMWMNEKTLKEVEKLKYLSHKPKDEHGRSDWRKRTWS